MRRWLPGRALVADLSFAAIELLAALAPGMTGVTRRRLDARLFTPAPARAPGWYGEGARDVELATGTGVWHHPGLPVVPPQWVLVRDPLGRWAAQARLSTDPGFAAAEVVGDFVRRWQLEVTFEEARRHLGVETQRQWSDAAIARTTPILLGLVSLVTLLAARLVRDGRLPVRTAAWYAKPAPTFGDALAAVRAHWWRWQRFRTSPRGANVVKLPRRVYRHLREVACYAA